MMTPMGKFKICVSDAAYYHYKQATKKYTI
jgi:hypothetical protein